MQENYEKDLKAVQDLEGHLRISRCWVPDDKEWQAAAHMVANQKYQRALDNLERLVMSWIFKLLKMNQAGCQNRFLRRTLMKVEESGGVYASLGTRQEGGRFEDVGLSVCASPLQILVLGFWRAEFQQSAVGPKVSRGVRETEETEKFTGSIQCDI